MATMHDLTPSLEKYAGMDPQVAAALARVDVHLANVQANLVLMERLAEENERIERAYYDAYVRRRRLFRF